MSRSQSRQRSATKRRPVRTFSEAAKAIFKKIEGSQPINLEGKVNDPCKLPWWPLGAHDKPLKSIFRAVTIDLEEFDLEEEHPARDCVTPEDLMPHICYAINRGSNERSPFAHFSTSFDLCRTYLDDMVIECNLVQMYYAGALSQHTVIDLSTERHWRKLFGGSQDRFGDEVSSEMSKAIHFSTKKREVLVKWRGTLPIECMTVLNPETGRVVGSLREILEAGGLTAHEERTQITFAAEEHLAGVVVIGSNVQTLKRSNVQTFRQENCQTCKLSNVRNCNIKKVLQISYGSASKP